MRIIRGTAWYTVEELVKLTGYQKGTVYNLTVEGVVDRPILGLPGSDYPSQGLYRECALHALYRYRDLKTTGMRKSEIVKQIKAERIVNEQQLPLLETRGEGSLEVN